MLMKLIYTPTSPYARKARMVIKEKGLSDRFELEQVDLARDRALIGSINPLGQVPSLILSEGEVIHDSPVICEFIDNLSAVSPVIPAPGKARWEALTDQALADGMTDAAVTMRVLGLYSDGDPPEKVMSRLEDKIHGALNQMDTRAAQFEEGFDIGQVSYIAAIDYLMFRFPNVHWRTGRPNLVLWYDQVKDRPSVVATRPS